VEAVASLFPFVLILAVFYLLIIRPARTRSKAAAQMQQQLAPGLEVMTTSGMFATVAAVEDDAVALEVAPGVRMRFAKAAVARILPADDDAGEESDDDADHADHADHASRADGSTDDRPESDQPTR